MNYVFFEADIECVIGALIIKKFRPHYQLIAFASHSVYREFDKNEKALWLVKKPLSLRNISGRHFQLSESIPKVLWNYFLKNSAIPHLALISGRALLDTNTFWYQPKVYKIIYNGNPTSLLLATQDTADRVASNWLFNNPSAFCIVAYLSHKFRKIVYTFYSDKSGADVRKIAQNNGEKHKTHFKCACCGRRLHNLYDGLCEICGSKYDKIPYNKEAAQN